MVQKILRGDIVKIKVSFRGASEPDIEYIAADNEELGRVDISPVIWEWRIIPRETVPVHMLTVVESCAS